MGSFCDDLITDILSRLPVKSLLRFKSLSRPWRESINDPSFTKLHLKQQSTGNLDFIYQSDDSRFYLAPLDSLGDRDFVCKDFPVEKHLELVGSCNGLICLTSHAMLDIESGLSPIIEVVLWNIATNEYRIIQNPPTTYFDVDTGNSLYVCYDFGFGYDSVYDDYKVVRMGQFLNRRETIVYSLRKNVWSKTRVYPKETCSTIYDAYVYPQNRFKYASDALHCLARGSQIGRLILAIDLVTEDFREVPLPDSLAELEIELSALGGCLCAVVTFWPYDVWVMKDYKIKESWTCLFQLPVDLRTPEGMKYREVAFSTNGDIVDGDSIFVVYDRKKEKSTRILKENMNIQFQNQNHYILEYLHDLLSQSLVSLKFQSVKGTPKVNE